MRQTVALLGSAPSEGPPTALPQVRDLPELVAEYTAAGLKVDLDIDGDLISVPGDVGLAAYRIAQESLKAMISSPGKRSYASGSLVANVGSQLARLRLNAGINEGAEERHKHGQPVFTAIRDALAGRPSCRRLPVPVRHPAAGCSSCT